MGKSETIQKLYEDIENINDVLSNIYTTLKNPNLNDRALWLEKRSNLEKRLATLLEQAIEACDMPDELSGDLSLECAILDGELSEMLNSFSEPQKPQRTAQNFYEQNTNSTPAKTEDTVFYETVREQLERAKKEIENARARTESVMLEANAIKLSAETEKAMLSAEMELEQSKRAEEINARQKQLKAEKQRLTEKIARRKAEITAVRNGLQNIKDSESAFDLREKLFSIQLVLDEEERSNPDIIYLMSKSLDDINHAVEISELRRRIISLNKKLSRKSTNAVAPARYAPARRRQDPRQSVSPVRRV